MNFHRLLSLVLDLGAILLENGAETYRVEESILYILHGQGIDNAEVFVIPSMIIATIHPPGSEKLYTQQRRIRARGTDLARISSANQLCRDLRAKQLDLDQMEAAIRQVRQTPRYSIWKQFAAYGLSAAFFSLFFGGGLPEALVALVAGLVVRFCVGAMGRLGTNPFFTNILASASLMVLACLATISPLHTDLDSTAIGALMLLVPGMTLTTCFRDTIAGDYISSLVKLLEVLMVGLGVALGAFISLSVFGQAL